MNQSGRSEVDSNPLHFHLCKGPPGGRSGGKREEGGRRREGLKEGRKEGRMEGRTKKKYRVSPVYCNMKNRHIFSTKNTIQNLKIASESSLNADLFYLSLMITKSKHWLRKNLIFKHVF